MKLRNYLLGISVALMGYGSLSAADIKPQKATFEDFVPLLEMAGYKVYDYSIAELADKKYQIGVTCREYAGDSLMSENVLTFPFNAPNIRMISDFPEEFQARIKAENCYDYDRGIYKCAEKIVIGTYHKNDSTTIMMVNIENMSTASFPLNLKPLDDDGKKSYYYNSRPFITGEVVPGQFIPLVFYGSGWIDTRFNVMRFCGANQLTADMSDELVRDVPHSYVVGVTLTPISE